MGATMTLSCTLDAGEVNAPVEASGDAKASVVASDRLMLLPSEAVFVDSTEDSADDVLGGRL